MAHAPFSITFHWVLAAKISNSLLWVILGGGSLVSVKVTLVLYAMHLQTTSFRGTLGTLAPVLPASYAAVLRGTEAEKAGAQVP